MASNLYPWEDPFTYQNAYLLERLREIKAGTFIKGYLHKRDVLVKSLRAGLASFSEPLLPMSDLDHVVPDQITIHEPVHQERKEHK